MSKTPVAGPITEGRILGTDWSIANIAKLLRTNAMQGAWDNSPATSSSLESVNKYYLRKVSAMHLPTKVSLIFMRMAKIEVWYASICFATPDGYLPWNQAVADLWLKALFGPDLPLVKVEDPDNPSVRQFTLPPIIPVVPIEIDPF